MRFKYILCLSPLDNVPEIKRELSCLGEFFCMHKLNKFLVSEFVKDHPDCAIFCSPNDMTYRLDKDILSENVSAISTVSTGTDHIDLKLCADLGIRVSSLADKKFLPKIVSTAEMAFGLMLSLVRNIPSSFDSVKRYEWEQIPFTGHQLDHLTIGIVGYGRLGSKMADYCDAFGMKVIVCDPYIVSLSKYDNCIFPMISEICDIVSLHVHLNEETRHMVNRSFFGNVKYIINTSRGAVVNEDDIISALEEGSLIGYATDVLEDELGNIEASKLIKRSNDLNIIITPHIAGTTLEAHKLAYNQAVLNLKE